jgi:protein-S-isoprenylcysteine O-methyltransferase Ste14
MWPVARCEIAYRIRVQTTGESARSVAAGLWIRGPVLTLAVPFVLAVIVPRLFERDPRRFGALWFAGWPLLLAGTVFYGSCLLRFLRAGGTPAIFFTRRLQGLIGREPGTLVYGGLYRLTRDPMYVGVVLAVFGQALLYRSASVGAYGAVLWIFYHFAVVLGEEPHLLAQYGDSYDEYCRAAPRWL